MHAQIETLHGRASEPVIGALADLRIAVFREFPYLYEGSVAYERKYLKSYAACAESTLVLARDGARVVGVATALPLTAHLDALLPPLRAAGYDPNDVYYFSESVLLPEYRGRGLGHRFFDEREAAARRYGKRIAAFCAVVRPDAHPRTPSAYVPHDAFWQKRGYRKRTDLVTEFSWRELGDLVETAKPMVFWLRELT
jgi:GNAT superfamily N-acetyltransferase